jgi:hypothetical protein
VLVSNAGTRRLDDDMAKHPFHHLDDQIKNEISALEEVKETKSFLERTYLLKGPSLGEISSVLIEMILKALKDKYYTYDAISGIKNDLLYRIDMMCTGPVDLGDKKIMHEREIQQRSTEYKSIDVKDINKIIVSNGPNSTIQNLRRDFEKVSAGYNAMPVHLDDEKRHKIHELIDEYNSFTDDELRLTYMQKFNEVSKSFDLYNDNLFLEFLK